MTNPANSALAGVLSITAQSVNVFLNRVRFHHQTVRAGVSAGTAEGGVLVQLWSNPGLNRGLQRENQSGGHDQ